MVEPCVVWDTPVMMDQEPRCSLLKLSVIFLIQILGSKLEILIKGGEMETSQVPLPQESWV